MAKINYKKHLKKIFIIRKFENLLLNLFKLGYIKGTTHTCIGQEATPVIFLENLTDEDCVISNHRSHGHFIAYSNLFEKLLLELMGYEQGICSGLAGSQHIHYKNFYSNGILGNLIPFGVGLALSKKIKKKNGIVYIFLGDGAFGQGIVYESLNFASLKNLRCMFIVENNQIAQTTPIKDHLAGDISKRFNSFNIKSFKTNSYDIRSLIKTSNYAKKYIKLKNKPCAVVVDTFRFNAHSKGDDTRNEDYVSYIKKNKDCVNFIKKNISIGDFNHINKITDVKIKNMCRNLDLKL